MAQLLRGFLASPEDASSVPSLHVMTPLPRTPGSGSQTFVWIQAVAHSKNILKIHMKKHTHSSYTHSHVYTHIHSHTLTHKQK